jgi:hypothetical protein
VTIHNEDKRIHVRGSKGMAEKTHNEMTLPPPQNKPPVQFDDEANRGHVVALHPAEAKKKTWPQNASKTANEGVAPRPS